MLEKCRTGIKGLDEITLGGLANERIVRAKLKRLFRWLKDKGVTAVITGGYAVTAKTDDLEALALFQKDPGAFDLVITDQTMPQMTGVRLAEELLRIRPDIPIILCTGYREKVDANAARAMGIRRFLMKPFSVQEMSQIIREALT
jgi:CheY-like chemotaxis protein